MMRFQHLGLSLFVTVLALPSQALAAWGDDWGTMVWETAPVGVPTFGLFGLGLLSLALVAGAVFTLRKRAWTASVLLLVLAIPPAAVASSITNLNIFSNGTAADANEVNSNFTKVKTAVNDNDSRIGTALGDAATAQAAADSAAIAVSDEVAARAAADTSLQGAIDAEAGSRASADALHDSGIGANATAIFNESAARSAADGTLQASIYTEAASRSGGDAALDTRVGVVESGVFSSGIEVTGAVQASAGFQSAPGEIPDDIWSTGATWLQGAEGSLGTAGGYGLSLLWNGYRQQAGSFGVCVEAGQPTGEACYQAGAGACSGGGDCVCADDYGTPSSVGSCGWTLGGVGNAQPFDSISYLHMDPNGINFLSSDYGDGDYPRKNLSAPGLRMRITPDGKVGIGTPAPSEKLMVTGNLRVYGPTSGTPEGGVISAERGGSGAIVLDPTGSTSGYTATLSLDNTGFKVGHNSASRDIQFQTGNTTRMQIATNGDVDIEGDLTFGPSNTSLTAALAAAGGSEGNLVVLGQGALANNTTGENNVAVGIQALGDNAAGDDNVALGAYGLANNTDGNNNVAVGHASLLQNQDGSYNTAVGTRSLYSNTSGVENTATGNLALYSNTTGYHNAAHGADALYSNTTGWHNTANGHASLYSNTTGTRNTATGKLALTSNDIGALNSANGYQALYSNTTGNYNTASGTSALYSNVSGGKNIALGNRAGYATTGSDNILIGNEGAAAESSTIRIGTPGTHTTAFLSGDVDVEGDVTFGVENTSLTSALASAGGGVAEINQDCAVNTGCFAGDGPGFPVIITSAGSYRLTSNLVVPDENTDGIKVNSDDVSIDLNNFAIIGPVTCSGNPLTCSPAGGIGSGVERASQYNYGTSVKNGSITGMGYRGVWLGIHAEVTNVRVRWNRGHGISVQSYSTVSGNTAYENAGDGIWAVTSTVSGNTSGQNGNAGIYSGGGSTVSGNTVNFNEGDGIEAYSGSTVSGNTVRSNGDYGLNLSSSTGYRDNVITSNSAGTVLYGVNAGGNVCNSSTTCP